MEQAVLHALDDAFVREERAGVAQHRVGRHVREDVALTGDLGVPRVVEDRDDHLEEVFTRDGARRQKLVLEHLLGLEPLRIGGGVCRIGQPVFVDEDHFPVPRDEEGERGPDVPGIQIEVAGRDGLAIRREVSVAHQLGDDPPHLDMHDGIFRPERSGGIDAHQLHVHALVQSPAELLVFRILLREDVRGRADAPRPEVEVVAHELQGVDEHVAAGEQVRDHVVLVLVHVRVVVVDVVVVVADAAVATGDEHGGEQDESHFLGLHGLIPFFPLCGVLKQLRNGDFAFPLKN